MLVFLYGICLNDLGHSENDLNLTLCPPYYDCLSFPTADRL